MRGARMSAPDPLPDDWPFTPAETRVAELLATGHSRQEMADLLGCGYATVCTHVRNMGQALRGKGSPANRIAAFMIGVALWTMRHPGEAFPATIPLRLMRDRTQPESRAAGSSPKPTTVRPRATP